MKNRNTVLILGITSILILISVQVFIINGVWKQKNERFAIKYFVLSQEAIYNIRREMSTDGFDTVRLLLDQYSGEAVKVLRSLSDEKELADRKKDILDYFNKVVNQEQDLSELLSKYFESRGSDKNFKYKIIFNNV
jgi:hypothetical protein